MHLLCLLFKKYTFTSKRDVDLDLQMTSKTVFSIFSKLQENIHLKMEYNECTYNACKF